VKTGTIVLFSADLLILMILRLSTLIQQDIQDHQQIISLYSECLLLLETHYLSQYKSL